MVLIRLGELGAYMPTTSSKIAKRQAVLVLGMHRSGTSALAGVLAKLGVQAPRHLLPQARDNPAGFWESSEVIKFHDRILESAGSRWSDWSAFSPDWLDSVAAEDFRELLPTLIEQEFGDARLFLLKDPRICRFAPFWLSALPKLEIVPKIVIPVRHPFEVADSLGARNTFGVSRSLLIWLRHVLDAEYATRGASRSFVRYQDLLDDWRAQVQRIAARLDLKWPRWSAAQSEIDEYLSHKLRHHNSGDSTINANRELLSWVWNVYGALQQLADESAPLPELELVLDRARNEFDRTAGVYAAVVDEQEVAVNASLVTTRRQLHEQTQNADQLATRLEKVAGEGFAYQQLIQALESTTKQQIERIAEMERAAAGLQEAIISRDNALKSCEIELDRLRPAAIENFEALRRSELQVGKLSLTVSEQSKELSARAIEVDGLNGKIKELSQSLITREMDIVARETELAVLKETTKQLVESSILNESNLEKAKSTVARLKAERRVHEENMEHRFNEIENLTRQLIGNEREAQRRTAEFGNREILLRFKLGRKERDLENARNRLTMLQRNWGSRIAGLFTTLGRASRRRGINDELLDGVQLVRQSEWFDASWYLEHYPDVAISGIDPFVQYLEYGAGEGRDPGPRFNTLYYLGTYADVLQSGMNPLLHFIRHGQEEKRRTQSVA